MNVLVLQTGLRGSASASRALVDAYLGVLQIKNPELKITVRDLAARPDPNLPAELIPVALGLTDGTDDSAVLTEELILDLEQADIIVIGVAFYNS